MEYRWASFPKHVDIYVDANLAACVSTRKSTIGGVMLINGNFIKAWCHTMPVLALSTAESELAAVTKGISEALGLRAVLKDFGQDMSLRLCPMLPLLLASAGGRG